MPPFKPISIITSQYLRKMGVPQAIPIGTGYTHYCDCGTKRRIYPDKVRLGFIPDNWFQFFYPKTGKTGPYIFGLGLLNYLFSKEIYVCEHEFYTGLSLGIMCVVAVKKLGPKFAQYCDKEIEKFESNWKKQHEAELKALQDLIDCEELEQWRAEGSLLLMEAKKENIELQLEAAYREAIMQVYKDVKNRLDYQVACRNVEQRINHKHMVSWLVKEVAKELPENVDKNLLTKHKEDLSALALRVK
ncbi:ATP synthase subunit b, mitochondrial-like [Lucilia cuprina]|uniref:ATP synthase subunit b, mitochondrial-like n=1 Tax=Lucilia cuprina TaxID=7375 RepID=UPI001F05EC1E|nr:ATP synthase subunit b, mitochondrial-like [Lucilia cuprina]